MLTELKKFVKYNCSHRREVLRIEKECLGYNTLLTHFHVEEFEEGEYDKVKAYVLNFMDRTEEEND